jgi:hypothetical protein
VWVYLENWRVQDGEIPELHVGGKLHGAGLRAACLSLREATVDAPEGLHELREPDPSSGRIAYQVTGIAELCREPNEVLMTVGPLHLLAEPAAVRQVPGTAPSDCVLERYSPDFKIPPVGARVTAACTWEVLAKYEVEFPALLADWRVRGLRIERRPTAPLERQKAQILHVDTVDHLERWADEGPNNRVTYLLDLDPVPPTGH